MHHNKRNLFAGPLPYMTILFKSLTVRGFIVGRDRPKDRWTEAIAEMTKWIQQVGHLHNDFGVTLTQNLSQYDFFTDLMCDVP